ncbi:MAG: nucleotidyltransferase domain-containing protein [Candidatus Omnitrophica bacterium]|nr:nucleotidyltransferase domain-containing protein [Candidatus Omnitrophota bacterium]
MTQKLKIKELLAELKTGLQALYGARLKGLYLYGSYARGEQEEDSDVDILIVLDAFVDRYGAEIDRTGHLISELSLKYDLAISRVFATECDWKTSDRSFFANVREDAVAA